MNPFRIVSLLWLGSFFGAVCAFVSQIVLARALKPEEYGAFAWAMGVIGLVSPLAGFGIASFWLKVFGEEGVGGNRWLSPSFRFTLVSLSVALLLVWLWALVGSRSDEMRIALFLLSPIVLGYLAAEMLTAICQVEKRYIELASWQFVPSFLRLAAVGLVVSLPIMATPQRNLIFVLYALVGAAMAMYALGQLVRIRKNGLLVGDDDLRRGPPLGAKEPSGFDVFLGVWPFGLATIFHLLYFQSAVVMLGYLSSDAAAGIYSAAFTVMMAIYLLPSVLFQKYFLPKFHRWASHDRARFLFVYQRGCGSMLLFGAAVGIFSWVALPSASLLIFGNGYERVADVLVVLSFCIPARFLSTALGAALVTGDHMKRKTGYMGMVALVNVALGLFLISTYGVIGAAVSTLVSEVLLLILYLVAVRKHVFGSDAWSGWFKLSGAGAY